MGGHHNPKMPEVPDYRVYKVEDAPQLMAIRQVLAVHGLKDPWLRNYVWHYTENINKYTTSVKWKYLASKGFKVGVTLGIITAALDYAFLDRYYGHGHSEKHDNSKHT